MDTIIRMLPEIRMATLEVRIHLSGSARAGAEIRAGDRTKAWKSKGGGDLDVRSGEEDSPPGGIQQPAGRIFLQGTLVREKKRYAVTYIQRTKFGINFLKFIWTSRILRITRFFFFFCFLTTIQRNITSSRRSHSTP